MQSIKATVGLDVKREICATANTRPFPATIMARVWQAARTNMSIVIADQTVLYNEKIFLIYDSKFLWNEKAFRSAQLYLLSSLSFETQS